MIDERKKFLTYGVIIFFFYIFYIIKEKKIIIFNYNFKGAQRNIIKTECNNYIDTLLWDRRGQSSNGDTLVICFEGNAGFYEIGITATPKMLQYSVLGWNAPGKILFFII